MLPVLLLLSLLYQGHALDYGTDFITAFPENIAYYFPGEIKLLIKCTGLYSGTTVNISGVPSLLNLDSGKESTTDVTASNMEETMIGLSNKTIRITSNKNIVVVAITKRGDSMQSIPVLPLTSLDTTYFIPFPNYTLLTSVLNTYQPSDWSSSALIFNFRLMIINADSQVNTVTVKTQAGDDPQSPYTINPYQMYQLQGSSPWAKVTSTGKVAVILTHPCVDTLGCRCNMIMHQIRPASLQDKEFIVPPFVLANISRLFVTSGDKVDLTFDTIKKTVEPMSLDLLDFFPTSGSTSSSITLSNPGSLRLIRPGMMLDFLPVTMFASCFLVSQTSQASSQILLIVPTTETDNVKQNGGPLSVLTWNTTGSKFSWALLPQAAQVSSVIWHPNVQIGVYFFEKSPSGITYGGPAIALNDNPDPRGCVVSDDVFMLYNDTLSWQASRVYCDKQGMVLASPSISFMQNKMVDLLKAKSEPEDVWLGLRRDLVTNTWYWQDETAKYSFSNWADGHPDKFANDFCVSTNMENFEWNSQRCCDTLKPMCSRPPQIVSSISTGSSWTWSWIHSVTPGLVSVTGTIE